jgi:hypothetical protein
MKLGLHKKAKVDWRKEAVGAMTVLGIVFMLAGFLGFLMVVNALVVVPFLIGMARSNGGGWRATWSEASTGKKTAMIFGILVALPIVIVGGLWLLVGGMDILIDALIILPISYIAIWYFWGRKHSKATFGEEGAEIKETPFGSVQRVFSSPIFAVVCIIIIVVILMVAGWTSISEGDERQNSKDVGDTDNGGKDGITPITTTLNETIEEKIEDDVDSAGNETDSDTPITTQLLVVNITFQAYDSYITLAKFVYGDFNGGDAITVPAWETDYTYYNETNTLIRTRSNQPAIAIPDVKITLTGTGGSAIVMTNATGAAVMKAIPIGTYSIKWEKAGYSSMTREADLGNFIDINEEATVTEVENDDGSISQTLWYSATNDLFLSLQPSGTEFAVFTVVNEQNYTYTPDVNWEDYMPYDYRYDDWSDYAVSLIPFAGVTYKAYESYEYTEAYDDAVAEFEEASANVSMTRYTLEVYINEVGGGTTTTTIRNLDRQQAMWGWTGLPAQIGLQNGIISTKHQMQSMYNSMWTALNSIMPYLQEIAGQTTVEGEASDVNYDGTNLELTYVAETDGTDYYETYVVQTPSANSRSRSVEPVDASYYDVSTDTSMYARAWKFYAFTPSGLDLYVEGKATTYYTASFYNIFTGYVNETFTIEAPFSFTLGSESFGTEFAAEDSDQIIFGEPEDGVVAPEDTTFDWY